jgi:D-alanyl-D-alanine carboxypeptidase
MPASRPDGAWTRIAAALCAALLAVAAAGCTGDPRPPDQDKPPAFAQLEAFSARMIEDGAPAVLIAVRNGDSTWTHAAGVRSLERREPATVGDPVQVGSITKSMVAVSVMKLVEEGRLNLDEQAGTYLPEFGSVLHPPGPVTLRKLLIHESGLPDFWVPLLTSGRWQDTMQRPLSLEQQLALAATVPWPNRLAQGFEYSSSNYSALGLIVQRLRGRPLGEVLKADSANPAGLEVTRLAAGPPPPTMLHGYVVVDGSRLDVTMPAWLTELAPGGAVSTVEEINRFYHALLQGRLLAAATVQEMTTVESGFYGLGLWRWNDTCTNGFYFGHRGDIDGYGSISMTSGDGSRQLTIAVTYPPAPPTLEVNPLIVDLEDAAENALNSLC